MPLVPDDDASAGAAPIASHADLTGIDVLLVEDEAATRETTRLLFESAGATVRAVDSAHAAHAALLQRQPHVIVSDIGLPDEDGYALLQEIRLASRAAHSADVPALALTAFARPADRRRALDAGFNEHLTKPVDPEQLLAIIVQLSQRKS